MSDLRSVVDELSQLRDWVESDTEPAETFPGLLWLDTSDDPHVLKRRNDADDGWVTVGASGNGNGAIEAVGSEHSDLSGPDGSATVAVPAGVEDGDLLVASVFHRDLGVAHPAGWEVVREDPVDGFDQWHVLLTRVADDEPADYSWSGGGSRLAAGIVALRSGWLVAVGDSGWNTEADWPVGTAFDSSSVDSPVEPAVLLSFLTTVTAGGDWSWSHPAGMNLLWGATTSDDRLHAAYEKVGKGATDPRSWTEAGEDPNDNTGVGALSIVLYRVSPGTNGGGGSVAVDDDGTEVVAEASRLNFGTGLSATDDGDGAVTIDAPEPDDGAYAETVGDGTETTFDVSHNLGTSDVQLAVIEDDTALVHGDAFTWLILDADTVRVVFTSAPATDDARVVVLASGGAGGNGGGGTPGLIEHQARFGRLADPSGGNSPSSSSGFALLFFASMDVTITEATFFPSGGISGDLRIRLVELTPDYSREIAAILHVGDWRDDAVADEPFSDPMNVSVDAGTMLAAIVEQSSGSFSIYAQSDGSTARAAATWHGLRAEHNNNYGTDTSSGVGVGSSLGRYGSTAMNCWIDYLA